MAEPTKWAEIRMTVNLATWGELLQQLNAELLGSEAITEFMPEPLIESGWLGRPGATSAEIEAAERRIGRPLPPSYRAFLAESDGWQYLNWNALALLPACQIEWLLEVDPHLVKIYDERSRDPSWGEPVSDEGYVASISYPSRGYDFRAEHLRDMLVVSTTGWNNGEYVFLNPHGIFPDGEWEAWSFVPGEGSAARHRSFRDLMLEELRMRIHDRDFPT